jgi:hypothetical protein
MHVIEMPYPGRRDTWRRGWCAQRELNPHVGLMKEPASDPVSCARPSVGVVIMPEPERRVVWTDVALTVPEGIRSRGVATSVGRCFAGAASRPTDGKVEASGASPIEPSRAGQADSNQHTETGGSQYGLSSPPLLLSSASGPNAINLFASASSSTSCMTIPPVESRPITAQALRIFRGSWSASSSPVRLAACGTGAPLVLLALLGRADTGIPAGLALPAHPAALLRGLRG